MNNSNDPKDTITPKHFIEQRIEQDLKNNTYGGQVITRFPPEPSGYLHIGHAKAIYLNFTMAEQYQGRCHLRFDDTNPAKEEIEFIQAIQADIKWLGFQWDALYHAADYFEQLHHYAQQLIRQGNAYVCSLSTEEMRDYRGSLTTAGKNSPYRERSVEENLDLFARMKAGEFSAGEHVLRAKIDMQSGNINMRDPVLYRILSAKHPHVGTTWNIYPMYDFAHCLSDAIENITHSLCSLEFQDHRPLYDWILEKLIAAPRTQQIEFSRLNLSHTITSKRKLRKLVEDKQVSGFDDPRMPTLIGVRRRGFTPAAIRNFCRQVGISKSDTTIDMSLLEEAVRDDLNQKAPRIMCVLDPIKVIIDELADDHLEMLNAANHPQNPDLGERQIAFTKTLYIDANDFMLDPPKKYFRLSPGCEVRLRHGYVIKCNNIETDPETGKIIALHCSYDKNTLGKKPEGRKVKGVIHWVSATQHRTCSVRLYDRLFTVENPAAGDSFETLVKHLNPNSLKELTLCYIESNLFSLAPETHYQFERVGYFVTDRIDSTPDNLIFNRVVALRDTWK